MVFISGWSRGVELPFGATSDMAEMVRAAAAWRAGATLRQIEQAAPFVEITEMALAHERGLTHAVNLAWRALMYPEFYCGQEAEACFPW